LEYDWFKVRLPLYLCKNIANDFFRAENMRSALKAMREEFGGVENYMIEKCGLTKEQIDRIRSNLVVDQPAVHQQVTHTL
jgi:hypothetical protein